MGMPQSITQHTNHSPITPATGPVSEAPNLSVTLPDRLRNLLGSEGNSSAVLPTAGQFLTIKQIALEMQMGLSSVATLIRHGRLQAVNVSSGRRPTYRISRDSFEQFKVASAVGSPVVVPVQAGRQKLPAGLHQFI